MPYVEIWGNWVKLFDDGPAVDQQRDDSKDGALDCSTNLARCRLVGGWDEGMGFSCNAQEEAERRVGGGLWVVGETSRRVDLEVQLEAQLGAPQGSCSARNFGNNRGGPGRLGDHSRRPEGARASCASLLKSPSTHPTNKKRGRGAGDLEAKRINRAWCTRRLRVARVERGAATGACGWSSSFVQASRERNASSQESRRVDA